MTLQPPKSGQFTIGAFPSPKPRIENNLDNEEKILDNNNIYFSDALDDLFAKMNQSDDKEQNQKIFSPKKETEEKLEENSSLLNSIFSPNLLFQNQISNEIVPFQAKEKFTIQTNDLIKINLMPVDSFSLGEYKFYPIHPDNLNTQKNIQAEIDEQITFQNLQKYGALDMEVIKNGILPNKINFQDNTEPLQNLQKGDLVNLNPIESEVNNNFLSTFPKINIEISFLEPENIKRKDNTFSNDYLNILETGNPKQKVLNFGGNFFGYPISHLENDKSLKTDYYLFKKEDTPDTEKQKLIGILSKDNTEGQLLNEELPDKQNKQLIMRYSEDKPKFSKIMTLDGLNYNINKLLNKFLKNKDDNEVGNENIKSFFTLPEKPIYHTNIKEKEIISYDFKNDNNLKDFKIENQKTQSDSLKNNDDQLKNKNIQNLGNFKFENISKDKKSFDLSKNGITQLNLEKSKLDTSRGKDLKEDSFFSFMSSQSENENKNNKNGVEEKISNDEKRIPFEKGIPTQTAIPIVISDKSTADFSNSIISAATRRAVDLSSQLQARGGGSAKIQIQDDKLGNIELNIHMKKDNTVTMEIKASDKDLKNILEKNSDSLKKSLDTQNISLTDFKVSTVEKSTQSGTSFASGQGFSQQQNHHNGQNSNFSSQDSAQQGLNQGFNPNNFTNGNNQFFKNPDSDFSFNKYPNQEYVNKDILLKGMEKNSITNIQRGANGSIKVLV